MSYHRLQDIEAYPLQQLPARSATVASEPSIYSTTTDPEEPPTQNGRDEMFNYRNSRSGSRRSLRTRAVLSYAPDWALCIILAAVFFALDEVPGFKRQFSLQDISLRHTYAIHERVPNWALYIIFAVAPLVLMPVINLLSVRSWWDFHSSWLGWLLSVSITGAITQFSKITVGRPRPDVIDRCQPMAGAADPPLGLSTVAICTQTDIHILRDGWRSFPSGHSSLSFAGLGFLSFYLAGKLHLFDEKGHTVKAWISLVPLAGAALVAISRTMDYRHHWQDVLTGSFLGLVVAYFAYRQYYPQLTSPTSHTPYPQRIKRGGHELPTHNREPSTAPVMGNTSFDNDGMRPRQAASRYSDRPSIGDEEVGRDSTLHPVSSTNVDVPKET
ncbi:acid phosphatase/Vanadium-dependent haloperoxidase [Polyporus arcularius HHB13444]|uniref:Acid phosphatase/Vanadium-dependent haloperoxidase n=1 Tax=Polyporus arcularius HHB13444 TaxID=1314778 RepID=A0A5C3PRT8_9APHY|nr:acid phosphatase/Vanadium-dependent haloperoxidase [Polyporus arcularius HHB13444]